MNRKEKAVYSIGRGIGATTMAVALWPALSWWSLLFMLGFTVFAAAASVETQSETVHEMIDVLDREIEVEDR